MALKLYNSLSKQLEEFKPLDSNHVKIYVCGPTVYDRPHLGNARSVVIYDVLYRLLKSRFGKVTYVRNITDVDDKINKAAKENGETIKSLTTRITNLFHEDMDALNCLRPDKEPRATDNISNIISMIKALIKNGSAYEAEGHVLFDVTKYKDYGKLSRRSLDDMIAGARVEVAPYKKNPGDFVLWKPSLETDDESSKFDSPWGMGRPGWHIECSAMATNELGENFDIHGGGADLMFPHHENEIAQSCCANPGSHYASVWVHNGFLTVNGEKMSKSLGNFTTVRDLLDKGIKGEVIRYALLSSPYRAPLNWTTKLLEDSQKNLDGFYKILLDANLKNKNFNEPLSIGIDSKNEVIKYLSEDLLFSGALAVIRTTASLMGKYNVENIAWNLKKAGKILGLLQQDPEEWFREKLATNPEIDALIQGIVEARKTKDYAAADKNKARVLELGYNVSIDKDGKITVTKK